MEYKRGIRITEYGIQNMKTEYQYGIPEYGMKTNENNNNIIKAFKVARWVV